MAPEQLFHQGRLVPRAIVLSHPEQLARLAAVAPTAVPAAALAGDPCYDRIRASRPLRDTYRRRLGLSERQTAVLVSSTWGPRSLFGSRPDLFRELLAELPVDAYRVLGVLHPNTWFGHGRWQLRAWLADCERAGLVLVPPEHGWQQALLAADVVVGDHGAVTGYAAAIGTPTLLAAFPAEDVAPGSPIDRLGQLAPRLLVNRPLRAQLHQVIEPDRFADVSELTSSFPDRAAERLRALCYRLMDLPEPGQPAPVHPYSRATAPTPGTQPTATVVSGASTLDNRVTLERLPAEFRPGQAVDGHLVVHRDHPIRTLRGAAGIVYCQESELSGSVETWLADTVRANPTCALAAIITADGACLTHDGTETLRWQAADPDLAPICLASVAYLSLGRPPLANPIQLVVGGQTYRVTRQQVR